VTDQEPPKIEFPCDYPIKVLGRHTSDFRAVVVEVMRQHAGDITDSQVKERPSGKGQIDAIFVDLKATGRVTMVL
jgi:putative lipoic acid-binding regulatory protein